MNTTSPAKSATLGNRKVYFLLDFLAAMVFFLAASLAASAQSLPTVNSGSLFVYLRADIGVVTNGNAGTNNVTAWLDQSPNGYEFDASANQTTLFYPSATNGQGGLPTIHFIGKSILRSASMLQLFSGSSSPLTVFTAFRATANSAQSYLLNHAVFHPSTTIPTLEMGVDAGLDGAGNYGIHRGGSAATTTAANTISNNIFYVMTAEINATGIAPANVAFYKNGTNLPVSSFSGTGAQTPYHPGWLGAGEYSAGAYELDVAGRNNSGAGAFDAFFSGDISEIIIYQGALTPADRAAVESYLGAKYGIAVAAPPTLAITTSPQNLAVTNGQSATFTVAAAAASGETDFTYAWQKNGSNILNATSSTFTIPSVSSGDAAAYRCVVTIPTATNTSAAAQLRLYANTFPAVSSGSLLVHLQADAGIDSDGTNISAWHDQSSNNFEFDASIDNATYFAPTVQIGANGNSVVDFDGASILSCNGFTQLFTNTSSPLTVFSVFTVRDNAHQRYLFSAGYPRVNNNVFDFGVDAGADAVGNFGIHRGGSDATYAPANTIGNSVFNVMSTIVHSSGEEPNNLEIYKNGVSQALTAFYSGGAPGYPGWLNAGQYPASSGPLYVGARLDSGQALYDAQFDGSIGEIIIYQGELSPPDRSAIENYLGAKFGVTITAPPALVISSQPQNVAVTNGQPATFAVTAYASDGETDLSYAWQKNGGAIAGATSSTYTIPSAGSGDAAAYACVISIPSATNTTTAAQLRLLTNFTLPNVTSGALLTHLSADSGVVSADGTNVTAWLDQSANAFEFDAQADLTTSFLPTVKIGASGNPVIHFDGDNNLVCSVPVQFFPTPNSPLTIFTVASVEDNSTQRYLVNLGVPRTNTVYNNMLVGVDAGLRGAGNYGVFRSSSDATVTSNNVIANNQFYVVSTILDSNDVAPNNISIFKNGVSQAALLGSYSSGTPTDNGFLSAGHYPVGAYLFSLGSVDLPIVGSANSISSFWWGDIGEVIIYQGQLSAFDRAQVESYLGAKYGVTVAPLPPLVITTQPHTLAVTNGQSATFTVAASTANGATNFTYQWQMNGANIPGATASSYTVPATDPASLGLYQCVVSIPGTSVASAPAVLRTIPNVSLPTVTTGSLLIDLAADKGVTTISSNNLDNLVTSWIDQSSNAFEFDSLLDPASYYPPTATIGVTGNPVIHFNGNTIMMCSVPVQLFTDTNSPLTIFSAFSVQDNATQRYLINLGVPRTNTVYNNLLVGVDAGLRGAGNYGIFRSSSDATVSPNNIVSNNQFYVTSMEIKSNGVAPNNIAVSVNGAAESVIGSYTSGLPTDPGFLSAGSYPVGAFEFNLGSVYLPIVGSTTSISSFWWGDMAEILIYQGQLSDADRGAVLNYLGQKYGTFPARLQLESSGANVVVSYPASPYDYVPYVLESTTNLTAPAIWTPVAPQPALTGSQYSATNSPSGQAVYYRLNVH